MVIWKNIFVVLQQEMESASQVAVHALIVMKTHQVGLFVPLLV
jgi:hypothetical protein